MHNEKNATFSWYFYGREIFLFNALASYFAMFYLSHALLVLLTLTAALCGEGHSEHDLTDNSGPTVRLRHASGSTIHGKL